MNRLFIVNEPLTYKWHLENNHGVHYFSNDKVLVKYAVVIDYSKGIYICIYD